MNVFAETEDEAMFDGLALMPSLSKELCTGSGCHRR